MRVREIVADLVGIPSVNPRGGRSDGGETAVAQYICQWAQGRGYEAELVEVELELVTPPVEVETLPELVETPPVEVETPPVDVETPPVEVVDELVMPPVVVVLVSPPVEVEVGGVERRDGPDAHRVRDRPVQAHGADRAACERAACGVDGDGVLVEFLVGVVADSDDHVVFGADVVQVTGPASRKW